MQHFPVLLFKAREIKLLCSRERDDDLWRVVEFGGAGNSSDRADVVTHVVNPAWAHGNDFHVRFKR
jgi:hypothetical protein